LFCIFSGINFEINPVPEKTEMIRMNSKDMEEELQNWTNFEFFQEISNNSDEESFDNLLIKKRKTDFNDEHADEFSDESSIDCFDEPLTEFSQNNDTDSAFGENKFFFFKRIGFSN